MGVVRERATEGGRPYNMVLILTFNIPTAFIRLGRAGPNGAGCPPYYYFYLTLRGGVPSIL